VPETRIRNHADRKYRETPQISDVANKPEVSPETGGDGMRTYGGKKAVRKEPEGCGIPCRMSAADVLSVIRISGKPVKKFFHPKGTVHPAKKRDKQIIQKSTITR